MSGKFNFTMWAFNIDFWFVCIFLVPRQTMHVTKFVSTFIANESHQTHSPSPWQPPNGMEVDMAGTLKWSAFIMCINK
jgi:hypothetical protein